MADTPKVEFETNIETEMSFPFGGLKAFKEFEHEKYGKSYLVNVDIEGKRHGLFASQTLWDVMQRAQIGKGETVGITKREKKVEGQDGKKKTITVWKVANGTETFSSDDETQKPPQDANPPVKSGAQGQKAPSSTSEPPHFADDPGAASGAPAGRPSNGNGKPFTFEEVVCLAWKAHHGALAIWKGIQMPFDADNVQASANSIAISCEKSRIHPSERDMKKFKAAMKGDPPTTAPPKPPGTPATGTGRVAGSDPVTGDVWFDLCESATNANIPDEEFEAVARKIVAAYLKVKALPASYDMKGMPKACIDEIEREISEYQNEKDGQ